MEKILVVINANKPDTGSIHFACRMAAMAQTRLTGLFIENLFGKERAGKDLAGSSYFKMVNSSEATEVITNTDQAVQLFKEECQRHKVFSAVYIDKGEPIQEVLFESRFADLLILDPGMSFYDKEDNLPSHFAKEILANAECPVLLAPKQSDGIEEIVFCYDGSPSSVFSIKQFTYLLPQFCDRKVLLLEVNKDGSEEFSESHRRMLEWLRSHYHSVYYHTLKGNVKDELFTYFFMKTKRMIVLGAYGRNLLSNFFKRSSADVLIRAVDLPLFITHH